MHAYQSSYMSTKKNGENWLMNFELRGLLLIDALQNKLLNPLQALQPYIPKNIKTKGIGLHIV